MAGGGGVKGNWSLESSFFLHYFLLSILSLDSYLSYPKLKFNIIRGKWIFNTEDLKTREIQFTCSVFPLVFKYTQIKFIPWLFGLEKRASFKSVSPFLCKSIRSIKCLFWSSQLLCFGGKIITLQKKQLLSERWYIS